MFDIFLQKLPGGAAATPEQHPDREQLLRLLSQRLLLDPAGRPCGDELEKRHDPQQLVEQGDQPRPERSLLEREDRRQRRPRGQVLERQHGRDRSASRRASTSITTFGTPGSKVGTHDKVAPSGFRNAAAVDFHLNAGAAAIDAGDPANSPARDIDGDARPAGPRPTPAPTRLAPAPRHRPHPIRRRRRRKSAPGPAARPAPPARPSPSPLSRRPVSTAASTAPAGSDARHHVSTPRSPTASTPSRFAPKDQAGNVDGTPASRTWTVETPTPPPSPPPPTPPAPSGDGDLFLSSGGSDSAPLLRRGALQIAQPRLPGGGAGRHRRARRGQLRQPDDPARHRPHLLRRRRLPARFGSRA